MKKLAMALAALVMMGCEASQQDLTTVAVQETARIAKPSRALSTFAEYELAPMAYSAEVQVKPEKVEQGKILEQKINAKLRPLLTQWSNASSEGRSGKVIIAPKIVKLRVISSGARFFAGAWAGDSFIDLDLVMTDEANQQIANARINRDADGFAGGFSVGQSDKNLLDYITEITYQYVKESY